ncbi:MAG: hypothetical protein EWV41_13295 [Microcystis wesenbergii Mw_MB_S_20031200_S109]|uniref:Uncharacterized protein n=1 Tax=Microcystis wesenbergii Mw_MB_S_20031200_S109D TaxID=2486241 RepID=A0A552M819_9CHRO|nr:MAG: hypothetical protein EWV41_13295 [Microcystis wesenbergii Mw_MB_S_20031200_S109]TRV28650.1 MAG: hypothetical protein EWV88_02560 [Microcystis wesenbergii Mw_MB_S_20031200_S109D]
MSCGDSALAFASHFDSVISYQLSVISYQWGDGEMGVWGSGEVGKWGSGEVGKWGDGRINKNNLLTTDY